MLPQLIFLGAPGSGKGTQAIKLSNSFGYKHISTGDLLRTEIAKDTELGRKVSSILSSGALVDDQTVLELLKSNCDTSKYCYIFDGFPRNGEQAKLLNKQILKDDISAAAVYFKIDLDELRDRLVFRRTCPNCSQIFNLKFKPPVKDNVCDLCNTGGLVHRKDDQDSVVETRLKIFKENIDTMLSFYRHKRILFEVDASLGADEVFEAVTNIF